MDSILKYNNIQYISVLPLSFDNWYNVEEIYKTPVYYVDCSWHSTKAGY